MTEASDRNIDRRLIINSLKLLVASGIGQMAAVVAYQGITRLY